MAFTPIDVVIALAPDHLDDRTGLDVRLRGHRTWLTLDEAQQLHDLLGARITELERSQG